MLRALVSLLVATTACRAAWWTSQSGQKDGAIFELVPADIQQKGRGYLAQLQAAGSAETLLDKLFGTDCYSASLKDIGSDCRHLTQATKSRLAFLLTSCHLRQLGQRSPACLPAMSLKQCADAQDDKGYNTYLKFLAEVDSICLFLQSQDFQKHTEHMLNVLYGGSRFATEALANATSQLTAQDAQLRSVQGRLVGLHELQESVARGVQRSQEQLRGVASQTTQLQAEMQASIELERKMLEKQAAALRSFEQHEEAEKLRAEHSVQRWQVAEEHAKALLNEQTSYREAQEQLLLDMRSITQSSGDLRNSVTSVLAYVRRSEGLLGKLLGQAFSLADIAFYGGSAAGILVLGSFSATAPARAPIAGILGVVLAVERTFCTQDGSVLLPESLVLPGSVWLEMILARLPALSLKIALRRLFLIAAAGLVLRTYSRHSSFEGQIVREVQFLRRQMAEADARQQQALLDLRLQMLRSFDAAARARKESELPTSPTGPLLELEPRPAPASTSQRKIGQRSSVLSGLDHSQLAPSSHPAWEAPEGDPHALDVGLTKRRQPYGPSGDVEPGGSSRGEASSSKNLDTRVRRSKPGVGRSLLETRPSDVGNTQTRRSSRLSKRPSLMPDAAADKRQRLL